MGPNPILNIYSAFEPVRCGRSKLGVAGVDRPLVGGPRADHVPLLPEQIPEVGRRPGGPLAVVRVDRPLVGGPRARHIPLLAEQVGGEFASDDAKLWYYEALTLADAEDSARAEHAAAVAISLYQVVPARARSYGCEALARVQLARARLMGRKLDDAADALGGMLSLGPQMRIGSLSEYLETCRELLRTPCLQRFEYRPKIAGSGELPDANGRRR